MTRRGPARASPPRWLPLLYLLALAVASLAYLLRFPIIRVDTDLWYHLTSGRYLFTQHAIPHESFFSFLTPPRPMVDYFWLFQAVVYRVFLACNYPGLIVFRAVMYGTTLALILALLIQGRHQSRALPWLILLGVCYCVMLIPRALAVRPHLVSYLCIVSSLYVLELHPRRACWLLLLSLLWVNMHGITYPVLLLIVGAYGSEWVVTHALGHQPRRVRLQPNPLWLLASAATTLLTPHGVRLLRMPWISTTQASEYIQELVRLMPEDLLSFKVTALAPNYAAFFNLLFFATCLALITALARRRLRLSHLLLCIGGGILLAKGRRFTYEYALLALPLLRAHPLVRLGRLTAQLPKPVALLSTGVLLAMPFLSMLNLLQERPAYPVTYEHLPRGVARFLRHVDVGGTVLNQPTSGGYLEWMLYPRYRIFMDMEVPHLFTDEDMYVARQVLIDDHAFRRVVTASHPAFLTVPKEFEDFPKLVQAFPEYTAVFFDNAEVLYVDATQHPDIARQYALQGLQPFSLLHRPPEAVLDTIADRPAFLARLQQMLVIDPDGFATNALAAVAYQREGAYARAQSCAEAIIRNFPDAAMGYRFRGDALQGLRLFAQALDSYRQAFEQCAGRECREVIKQQGRVYLAVGAHAQAYRQFKEIISLSSTKVDREELYQLGQAARLAGHRQEATTIMRHLAAYRIVPEETNWMAKVTQELRLLDAPTADTDGARNIP